MTPVEYSCFLCGGRFRRSADPALECGVVHGPGECWHYGETLIDAVILPVPPSRVRVTIDERCTMRSCKENAGVYRMVGRCSNCGTDEILFLLSTEHRAPSSSLNGSKCPICGCKTAYAQRVATLDEVPDEWQAKP